MKKIILEDIKDIADLLEQFFIGVVCLPAYFISQDIAVKLPVGAGQDRTVTVLYYGIRDIALFAGLVNIFMQRAYVPGKDGIC